MKYAFISTLDTAKWGGSEELWSRSATQLKKAGHEIFASLGYWARESEKAMDLARQGIELEFRIPETWGGARRILKKLTRNKEKKFARLQRFRPDLAVISQAYNGGGFDWAKWCRNAGIPYVIIVQCNSDLWWFHERDVSEAVTSYREASRVYCVSRANLELLRLQVSEPLPNAEVVWNPYNVSPENPPSWPEEDEKWRMACVARLEPCAKGQDLLIQTLARPEWRDRPIEVNLFGAGPYELNLRRMVKMLNLKNVAFQGHVDDVRAIWERNHLLALPSRYEGLPLALVEAMWCGRPAIVTDVGGNAELCVDGETGFVAEAATLLSFNKTLNRAWEKRSEWATMGKEARARAEEIVPRDTVSSFCERLQKCVAMGCGEVSVA